MRTAILRVESWSWLGMRYPSIPPGLEMVFHGFPHKCHSRVFLRPVTASQPSSVLQRQVWGSWWPRTTSVRCSGSKPWRSIEGAKGCEESGCEVVFSNDECLYFDARCNVWIDFTLLNHTIWTPHHEDLWIQCEYLSHIHPSNRAAAVMRMIIVPALLSNRADLRSGVNPIVEIFIVGIKCPLRHHIHPLQNMQENWQKTWNYKIKVPDCSFEVVGGFLKWQAKFRQYFRVAPTRIFSKTNR